MCGRKILFPRERIFLSLYSLSSFSSPSLSLTIFHRISSSLTRMRWRKNFSITVALAIALHQSPSLGISCKISPSFPPFISLLSIFHLSLVSLISLHCHVSSLSLLSLFSLSHAFLSLFSSPFYLIFYFSLILSLSLPLSLPLSLSLFSLSFHIFILSNIFINKFLMDALYSCTTYFLQYSILLGFNPR